MIDDNELYLTIDEYATQNNVSRRTVSRWIQQGLIFSVKIKGRRYIPADEPSPNDLGTFKEPEPPEEPIEGEPFDDNLPEEDNDFQDNEEPEEEDCGGCPCDTPEGVEILDPDTVESRDRRRIFPTYDDAVSYAAEIPITAIVFRRTRDCLYQVFVIPSD